MKQLINYAEVNSSYSIFYGIFVIIFSFLIVEMLGALQAHSFYVIAGFALLTYFIWDFVKQLYSAGQAVILYFVMFFAVPVTMNLLFGFQYAYLGLAIYIGALIAAGLVELIYESVVKKHAPKSITKRLFMVDNKIDQSIIKLSDKHVFLTEYKGIIIGLAIIAVYFVGTYLLLHR